VYFAWPGWSSGRSPVASEHAEQVAWELGRIKALGVGLHLLLNASCYGERALSTALEREVAGVVGELRERFGLDAVTTMSPLVARAAKRAAPGVDVRASVNMRLGTVRAMRYVAHLFDSFCVQREYNRDPVRLAELGRWAAESGKRLHVLANSGCLNFCAAQTFHDNAVAHEPAVNEQENVGDLTTLCREYYADRGHWLDLLTGHSWIRPEDVGGHAEHFDGGYKLATRMHDRPRMVIAAYVRGRHAGNLLDLLEPGLGPVLYPHIVDNTRFPADWFERTWGCGSCAAGCTYCEGVLAKVVRRVE
jgi:hypothetical protein